MGIDIAFGEGSGRRPIHISKREEAREATRTTDDPDDKTYRSSPDEGSRKRDRYAKTNQSVQDCENIVQTVQSANPLNNGEGSERVSDDPDGPRTILHEEIVRQRPCINSGLYDANEAGR
jgi:hypothetical protein